MDQPPWVACVPPREASGPALSAIVELPRPVGPCYGRAGGRRGRPRCRGTGGLTRYGAAGPSWTASPRWPSGQPRTAVGAPRAVGRGWAEARGPATIGRGEARSGTRHPRGPDTEDGVDRDERRGLLRPVRPCDRRRSLPGLETAAGRSADLLQRAVRLLRADPLRRRRKGPGGLEDLHLRQGIGAGDDQG